MRCTRDRLCFLNGLLHQLRQGKDFVRFAHKFANDPEVIGLVCGNVDR